MSDEQQKARKRRIEYYEARNRREREAQQKANIINAYLAGICSALVVVFLFM